ncbi:hypothetical protein ANTHELSMS3_01399 [Antarctobacter heliothermus]|uniref:UPF0235 protein ANTHELSMS3_01399 n=1 Tax=Antarctobacter heliothermus TaxID=74033 RepID=A0A222E290_9RHOB|nr:DUF167 domain-containing protein [Antarctobacter heliothermus]ASP20098.1 hypothetical protein ANTHELSMS3_01399 [Antarctobacter heliothermus]MBT54821.1 hypothetical protein [Mameliella sp.]|tara:strand:+ start:282 stop:539 length:258 start_codon:yes stop_codon:yes gene_type:complete
MKLPDLSDLAIPGTTLAVRVTPKAARNAVLRDETGLRVTVTTVPEGGKANAAVIKLLAKALGVPKSRLELLRGETSRDKLFRIAD